MNSGATEKCLYLTHLTRKRFVLENIIYIFTVRPVSVCNLVNWSFFFRIPVKHAYLRYSRLIKYVKQ